MLLLLLLLLLLVGFLLLHQLFILLLPCKQHTHTHTDTHLCGKHGGCSVGGLGEVSSEGGLRLNVDSPSQFGFIGSLLYWPLVKVILSLFGLNSRTLTPLFISQFMSQSLEGKKGLIEIIFISIFLLIGQIGALPPFSSVTFTFCSTYNLLCVHSLWTGQTKHKEEDERQSKDRSWINRT